MGHGTSVTEDSLYQGNQSHRFSFTSRTRLTSVYLRKKTSIYTSTPTHPGIEKDKEKREKDKEEREKDKERLIIRVRMYSNSWVKREQR